MNEMLVDLKCERCGGSGSVEEFDYVDAGPAVRVQEACPDCDGTGALFPVVVEDPDLTRLREAYQRPLPEVVAEECVESTRDYDFMEITFDRENFQTKDGEDAYELVALNTYGGRVAQFVGVTDNVMTVALEPEEQ